MEQLSISKDASTVSEQCSATSIPITIKQQDEKSPLTTHYLHDSDMMQGDDPNVRKRTSAAAKPPTFSKGKGKRNILMAK